MKFIYIGMTLALIVASGARAQSISCPIGTDVDECARQFNKYGYVICIGLGACSQATSTNYCSIALGRVEFPKDMHNVLAIEGQPPEHLDRIDERVLALINEYIIQMGVGTALSQDYIDRWNETCGSRNSS